jgi:hypothetical protein
LRNAGRAIRHSPAFREGRSEDAAELAQIIGEMTTLGDMESAFLIAIGRAALAGHKAAPQTEAEAKVRPATLPPSAEATSLPPRARGEGGLTLGSIMP